MDSLLEKLRAAAPQAKDQRDRRRRARLKERHQNRIASGHDLPPDPAGLSNADGTDTAEKKSDNGAAETDLLGASSPDGGEATSGNAQNELQVSEGEDVADRAASMLQGLRNNNMEMDGERLRRRRESAEEERRNRRLRRRNGASGSKDGAESSSNLAPVTEPASPARTEPDEQLGSAKTDKTDEDLTPMQRPMTPLTPSIVVSPMADQPDSSPILTTGGAG